MQDAESRALAATKVAKERSDEMESRVDAWGSTFSIESGSVSRCVCVCYSEVLFSSRSSFVFVTALVFNSIGRFLSIDTRDNIPERSGIKWDKNGSKMLQTCRPL